MKYTKKVLNKIFDTMEKVDKLRDYLHAQSVESNAYDSDILDNLLWQGCKGYGKATKKELIEEIYGLVGGGNTDWEPGIVLDETYKNDPN